MNHFDEDALRYHSEGRPGKIEVVPSKACHTDQALSLAYTPGVAAPCKEIAKNPDKAYDYTAKGNLVAVITNGTAVLGLGNIGPLAGKPVMEGKAVLFKQFADIDVFDLELNAKSTAEFISSVRTLEPTFGGINLEDIRSPECFEIEETLQRELSIPVFHDDQHGTAIVVSAALINACYLTKRELKDVKIVFCGAGAAAIACAKMFLRTGVLKSNITMCDLHGVVFKGRVEEMDKYKAAFAQDTKLRTVSDVLENSDVLVGLSAGNCISGDMIKGMALKPIIFALANPTPEIDPKVVREVRPDAIIATGRSDFPNQVNNILGFPYIFRGALDVRATKINEEMMLAATHAIAALAREDVPDSVSQAYGDKSFSFGPDYILPKPFDSRVLLAVAPAVAMAAMASGVARKSIHDFEIYRDQLEALQGPTKSFIRSLVNRVKQNSGRQNHRTPRIVFPEGANSKILKAVNLAVEENLVHPILIGSPEVIHSQIRELGLTGLKDIEILDPNNSADAPEFCQFLFETRKRKGITQSEATRLAGSTYYYAALAVALGRADGLLAGANSNYADCVRPILQTIGVGKSGLAAGLNIVLFKGKIILFADTSMNKCPTSEELAQIAIHASKAASYFGLTPKIAMLSYSNFTGEDGVPHKMKNATDLVKRLKPELIVDGEMQADTAIDSEIVARIFPFCEIKNGANILIFPNLESGNISYKLLQQLGGGEVIGPFIMGLMRPANVVARASSTEDIYNTLVMTALQVQAFEKSQIPHSNLAANEKS